jgi:hypothetical protein
MRKMHWLGIGLFGIGSAVACGIADRAKGEGRMLNATEWSIAVVPFLIGCAVLVMSQDRNKPPADQPGKNP